MCVRHGSAWPPSFVEGKRISSFGNWRPLRFKLARLPNFRCHLPPINISSCCQNVDLKSKNVLEKSVMPLFFPEHFFYDKILY